jgi:hypothetical protein
MVKIEIKKKSFLALPRAKEAINPPVKELCDRLTN